MARKAVLEAWKTLGVDEGASAEEARSAYKRLALKTHPDKQNAPHDSEEYKRTCDEFAAVSTAWETLHKHYTNPEPERGPFVSVSPFGDVRAHGSGWSTFGFGGGGFSFHSGGFGGPDYDSDSDEDYEDYSTNNTDDEEDIEWQYMKYAFEQEMRQRAWAAYSRNDFFSSRPQGPPRPQETPEQAKQRMRQRREAQQAAEKRRVEEERLRKERRAEEEAAEVQKAAERRKQKAHQKKRDQQKAKTDAAAKVSEGRAKTQALRDAAFASARAGNSEAVKKAVYEDNVWPSDGQYNSGSQPEDLANPNESLLHIAASKGDLDLVLWLVAHGATPEDRDSNDSTFFHRGLASGGAPLVIHLLREYKLDDKEHLDITRPPAGESLLSLAVSSGKPDIVRLLLNAASAQDVEECYAWLEGLDGTDAAVSSMMDVLGSKSGFKRPPKATAQPSASGQTAASQPKKRKPARKAKPAAAANEPAPPLQEQRPPPQPKVTPAVSPQPTPSTGNKPPNQRRRRKPNAQANAA